MLRAVEALELPSWVILYVKRWLAAPVQMPGGTMAGRDRGTPQGSPVSPVLANLVLHHVLDMWLDREFPGCPFERFADDAVVHCRTLRQAREVLDALTARLEQAGLRLHPGKTRIVYCRDGNRRQPYDGPDSFTFLGFTYRARTQQNRHGQLFDGFAPAISREALAAKGDIARAWKLARRTALTQRALADLVNPVVRGWMQYYGRYNRHELYPLLARINHYIQQWVRKKHKRLRKPRAMLRAWKRVQGQAPGMFAHWQWVTAASW
jgi:RNA-directed DNA polymerase